MILNIYTRKNVKTNMKIKSILVYPIDFNMSYSGLIGKFETFNYRGTKLKKTITKKDI